MVSGSDRLVRLSEEIKRFVREQQLGFVASVCPDGTPNLSPKGTTDVWDDEHLVFADIKSPRTVENLRSNPSVEINVVDQFSRKGYRFKGTAQVLQDGPLFKECMTFYEKKVRDGRRRIRTIVLVKVERVAPIISPAYDYEKESTLTEKWLRYYVGLKEGKLLPPGD
jgi:uncharacterized protein